jgi:hypothetical protein
VLRWIDYPKPVGSFVRRRAIFIETGRHSRRTTQCHKKPFAVWGCMNPAGSFPCLKSRDDRVRRAVNHADIARSFIADINKIAWRFSPHQHCARNDQAKDKLGIHASRVHRTRSARKSYASLILDVGRWTLDVFSRDSARQAFHSRSR